MMDAEDDKVQGLYYNVMTLDPFALIKGSCECFEAWSWWLPVHLIDILMGLKVSAFPSPSSVPLVSLGTLVQVKFGSHGDDLRAFLFREFTEHLMTEPSLFAIVPSYFTSCGNLGLDHLECFLERVPVESETKARKLLRVCGLHQLTRLEQSICRVMGRRAMNTGQTGSALAWYTRAGDEGSIDIITQLANSMLRDYQQARLQGRQPDLQRKVRPELPHLNVANCIVATHDTRTLQVKMFLPAVTMSGRMEFLRDYCAFLGDRQFRRYPEAADRMMKFFDHNVAPKWFWVELLLDALPLLEVPGEVVFSEAQTFALMQVLEELTTSMHSDRYLTSGHPGRQEQLEELRLALARNLASAIMATPSR